ncbi:uncharacterized protein CCOS01_12060 [Colletotrichum costaricense]|uniref:Protein kinase domain-containing protein n=1 Tax=Colletotrichum costaricense TaxID=1209916 RepID=A0AAI9YPD4_9PEZI|nr:uncharacterized protein CCOS01_12060 [Colletotrichum costaricense]KAK1517803.1 hypothetical protein CCOS01_12060 [Colletotrichum costaricense]
MEAFGTALATTTLVVQYVSACAGFSSQAKSLAVRLEWDLRAMKIIKQYFEQRDGRDQDITFRPEDDTMLERTLAYLEGIVSLAQRKLITIQRKGFLNQVALGASWIARRADLEDLEAEVFAWTQRFGVHVLDLSLDLRTSIQIEPHPKSLTPPVIKSNDRLRQFARLDSQDKKVRAHRMLLQDPTELAARIASSPYIPYIPLRLAPSQQGSGNSQLILASRQVSQTTLHDPESFSRLEEDMGLLAAALTCLDPAANVCLLRVEHYFYHKQRGQFIFVHYPPFSVESMASLDKRINLDPFPNVDTPLEQRLKLAHKLAEAVLFLHTADFLHKSITTRSIVVLNKSEESSDSCHSDDLGDCSSDLENTYLMGFDLIRGADEGTTKEGAAKQADDSRSIWEFDIYQHADRQNGKNSRMYVKVYDVYSLGVVLLEIGLWQSLSKVAADLDGMDPKKWSARLGSIATANLKQRVGERYTKLVCWCLALAADNGMKETDFVQNVLDPLEEMANTLSC